MIISSLMQKKKVKGGAGQLLGKRQIFFISPLPFHYTHFIVCLNVGRGAAFIVSGCNGVRVWRKVLGGRREGREERDWKGKENEERRWAVEEKW